MDFDVVIIGGGPGGYVSGIRASQLGLKVAIIERENVGGTCLNKGCIPTKALLQSAKVKHIVEKSSEFGINANVESIDFMKIVERAKNVVSGLNKGVLGLLSKNNIKLIKGTAKFIDKNTLSIDDREKVSAKNIVIATGAKPRILPGISDDLIKKGLVWTSTEAMFSNRRPEKILIVGSGAIGIEFASFYNTLGSDITIVEIQGRILIQEDEEISKAALNSFKSQGMKILTNTSASNFIEDNGKLSVEINGQKEIFDVCILAIGVVPNTKDLNLENIGIQTNKNGTIIVDDYLESSIPGIYAIGDVVNVPWLAHKASKEGILCAERIAGLSNIYPIDLKKIPACTYSNPQIASIGMTEKSARDEGIDIKIGRSYFRGNGKALAVGESFGFVKVIFDSKTREILGAHMIGHEVTELLPIFSVAITGELTADELIMSVFPHPTMSECIQESVMEAFGIGIHA